MAPEEAECNLINCLQWCHSVGNFGLWVILRGRRSPRPYLCELVIVFASTKYFILIYRTVLLLLEWRMCVFLSPLAPGYESTVLHCTSTKFFVIIMDNKYHKIDTAFIVPHIFLLFKICSLHYPRLSHCVTSPDIRLHAASSGATKGFTLRLFTYAVVLPKTKNLNV